MLYELVDTERSYVKRIKTLWEVSKELTSSLSVSADFLYPTTMQAYAEPLRKLASHEDTKIIPKYQAQTLFGNIEALLKTNTSFLVALERHLKERETGRITMSLGDVIRSNVSMGELGNMLEQELTLHLLL
jgi:hypothetical protein